MENKKIQCCFSEIDKDGINESCSSFDTIRDLDNVQVRYFCDVHMKKVESVRKQMAQKYIDEYKNKILNFLINFKNIYESYLSKKDLSKELEFFYKDLSKELEFFYYGKVIATEILIEKIKIGDFE